MAVQHPDVLLMVEPVDTTTATTTIVIVGFLDGLHHHRGHVDGLTAVVQRNGDAPVDLAVLAPDGGEVLLGVEHHCLGVLPSTTGDDGGPHQLAGPAGVDM
eukprot:368545_1